MQKVILTVIVFILNISLFAQYKVQFVVEDLSLQKHDSIFIAGTFTQWGTRNTGCLLKPLKSAKKTVTLNLSAGIQEYKFTRGDWLTVERNEGCGDIENRKIEVHADTVIYTTVPFWRDECTGQNLIKAQQLYIDSLFNSIETSLSIQEKSQAAINTYRFLDNFHRDISLMDSVFTIMNQLNLLANTAKDTASFTDLLFYTGDYYYTIRSFDLSIKYFDSAAVLYSEMNQKTGLSMCYDFLASAYVQKNFSKTAIQYIYKNISLLDKTQDTANLVDAYLSLGRIYLYNDQPYKSIEALNKSLLFSQGEVTPNVYKAENFIKLNRDDSAKACLLLAAPVATYKSVFSSCYFFRAKGYYHKYINEPDSASFYFLKAIAGFEIALQKHHIAECYFQLGEIEIQNDNTTKAEQYFIKSIESAVKFERYKPMLKAYLGLSIIYERQNRMGEGFFALKKCNEIRDSLKKFEAGDFLVTQELQYQFSVKENLMKEQQLKKEFEKQALVKQQKQTKIFATTGIAAILLFGAYGFYHFRKRKRLENQQSLLNERLRISRELHDDMGSTLGSISIYSEVAKNRSAKNENADEVILKIGAASRELIDKMSDIVWSINPNNESIEQLQKRMQTFAAMILTPHNIQYNFLADDAVKKVKLPAEERKNIFLIFKEAIHNIVKYAECKTVEIKISAESNQFEMVIKDDGKGFETSPQPYRSVGTGSPKERENSLDGNGLINMQVRAEDIKAVRHIRSAVNKGTTIKFIHSLK